MVKDSSICRGLSVLWMFLHPRRLVQKWSLQLKNRTWTNGWVWFKIRALSLGAINE